MILALKFASGTFLKVVPLPVGGDKGEGFSGIEPSPLTPLPTERGNEKNIETRMPASHS